MCIHCCDFTTEGWPLQHQVLVVLNVVFLILTVGHPFCFTLKITLFKIVLLQSVSVQVEYLEQLAPEHCTRYWTVISPPSREDLAHRDT